jgi:hypothetical protein
MIERLSRKCPLLLFALFMLLTASVNAAEHYVRTEAAVFPAAQATRALVYFARVGNTASWREADSIFVDAEPLGLLPKDAYLAAYVDPGFRYVWWSAFASFTGEWFNFKPGHTYLLRAGSRQGYWYLDDPACISEVVRTAGLSHVSTTEDGLSKLRQQAAGKHERLERHGLRLYRRAQVQAGHSGEAALPLVVGGVDYQQKLGRFKEPRFWGHFGELRIDRERLHWKSSKQEIDIPVNAIQEISFAGLSVREHVAWLHVRYGPEDAPRQAFFQSPVGQGILWSHNRKFTALTEAVESAGAR